MDVNVPASMSWAVSCRCPLDNDADTPAKARLHDTKGDRVNKTWILWLYLRACESTRGGICWLPIPDENVLLYTEGDKQSVATQSVTLRYCEVFQGNRISLAEE